MSPEQVSGQPIDARSDVWAFACVLYEMLTGHQAFGGTSISADIRPQFWRASQTGSACRRLCRSACVGCCAGASSVTSGSGFITSPTCASSWRTRSTIATGRAVALLAAANRRRARVLGFSTAVLALTRDGHARRVGHAHAAERAGVARGRDHDAADGRSCVVCDITRWAAAGVCCRTRRAADAVGTRSRLREQPRAAGHGRRAPAVLVAGQPLDRRSS